MPRGTSSGVTTQVQRKVVKPVLLYEGQFTSGNVNLWTGPGTLSFNAKTWINLGKFMGISSVADTADGEAQGIACTLSGIPNDVLGKALTEIAHGYTGTLWFGALDDSGALICDPVADVLFKGLLDIATVKKARTTSSIEVRYEPRTLNKRARIRRYTDEDQRAEFPGDLGAQYLNQLMTMDLNTGTGGIAGAGGPSCFSGNTRCVTPLGNADFVMLWEEYKQRGVVTLVNDFGPAEADILRHHEEPRRMLDMGDLELVTLEHEMRLDAALDFRPALMLLSGSQRVLCYGPVFTAHIRGNDPARAHFRLANGWTAHNKVQGPLEG